MLTPKIFIFKHHFFQVASILSLVAASTVGENETDVEVHNDKNQIKRSIIYAFSSNPIFHRVFNEDLSMKSLPEKFFDVHQESEQPKFVYRRIYFKPHLATVNVSIIEASEIEPGNSNIAESQKTEVDEAEQYEDSDDLVYYDEDEESTEQPPLNLTEFPNMNDTGALLNNGEFEILFESKLNHENYHHSFSNAIFESNSDIFCKEILLIKFIL